MISQLWEYDEAVRNSTGNFFAALTRPEEVRLPETFMRRQLSLILTDRLKVLTTVKSFLLKSESCYMKKLLISLWIIVLQGLQLKKLKKSIF